MLKKCAGLLLIFMLLFGESLLLAAPKIAAASLFAAEEACDASAQTRTARKRRKRQRRPRRNRQQPTQSNPNPAIEAAEPAKSPNKGQPVLRVYDPSEDGPPPVRPTPTPGMRDPEK
ncbi:MAG TPA: hypothetical protein VF658_09590 [Pyrinomonadaceae bacterium]|jgi:hypothetical protein